MIPLFHVTLEVMLLLLLFQFQFRLVCYLCGAKNNCCSQRDNTLRLGEAVQRRCKTNAGIESKFQKWPSKILPHTVSLLRQNIALAVNSHNTCTRFILACNNFVFFVCVCVASQLVGHCCSSGCATLREALSIVFIVNKLFHL